MGRPPQFAEISVFAHSAPRPLARVAPHLPFGDFFLFYCSCPAHGRGANGEPVSVCNFFVFIDPCRSHITFAYYPVTGHPTYVLRCESVPSHGLTAPTHGRLTAVLVHAVLLPTPHAACRSLRQIHARTAPRLRYSSACLVVWLFMFHVSWMIVG